MVESNIYKLIRNIENRPELYLGNRKLTSLYFFINGYLLRCIELDDFHSQKIKDFHGWIRDETGVEIDNWKDNLLADSNNDEEKALMKFFFFINKFYSEIAS